MTYCDLFEAYNMFFMCTIQYKWNKQNITRKGSDCSYMFISSLVFLKENKVCRIHCVNDSGLRLHTWPIKW